MLPFLLLFSCATLLEDDIRSPCPDAPAWDPNRPLAVRWSQSGLIELNEHVARRITLAHADGTAIEGTPFAFPGGLGLCVLGGLPVDTNLAWTVSDGSEPLVQEVDRFSTLRTGRWLFHTAAVGVMAVPNAVDTCVETANTDLYDEQCTQFDLDTGDGVEDTGAGR